jgi:hypothetical protein
MDKIAHALTPLRRREAKAIATYASPCRGLEEERVVGLCQQVGFGIGHLAEIFLVGLVLITQRRRRRRRSDEMV